MWCRVTLQHVKSESEKVKDEYSLISFAVTTVDGVDGLQCILCDVVLCNLMEKQSLASNAGFETGHVAET